MKNIIISATIIAALLFSSCVKEPSETGDTKGGANGKITFILPNASSGTITYAGAVGDEAKLEHLDIYMFDKTVTTLEWVYRSSDIGLGVSGNANTATIDATERTGAKVLFFVGNADGVVSQLDKARHGETTIEQFRDMVCDVHADLPVTPLIMTAETEIADITDPQDNEKKVKLIRRVARFDIDNTASDSNFTIEKIFIGNVNKQGYMFNDTPGGTRVPATMASGKIGEITFGTDGNKNAGLEEAVFYTFPTTIGDGKTTISFEGKFMNKSRIYNLDMGADFSIEANKRYILKPKKIDVNKIEWQVTVDPWVDGIEIEAKPNDKRVTITEPVVDSGDGVLTGRKLDVSAATAPTVMKLTASSFHKDGVDVNIVYDNANAQTAIKPVVNNVSSILTYGAHYEQAYEITIPAPANTAPASLTIEFVSKADPRERQKVEVVTFQNYADTQHKPVMIGGLWWAPVNLGAKNIAGTTKSVDDVGRFYQWGRSNNGWAWDDTLDLLEGPVSYSEAMSDANKNKFITTVDIPWNWLDTPDSTLWETPEKQNICPSGWRLPTFAEFDILHNVYTNGKTVSDENKKWMKFEGDNSGEFIYLNVVGFILRNNDQRNTGDTVFLSSDFNKSNGRGYGYAINSSLIARKHTGYYCSDGFSVRCVADGSKL